MHILIFQYINVTEKIEKKKKSVHMLCYSTKRDFLQKLHPYIMQAGHVNTTAMHLLHPDGRSLTSFAIT